MLDSIDLANLEIKWWQGHHRKEADKVIDALAHQFIQLYNLSAADAVKAAELKLQAGAHHDTAEKAEDVGNKQEADRCWNLARELLKAHFDIIINRQVCSWCEQPKHMVDFICDECFNAHTRDTTTL